MTAGKLEYPINTYFWIPKASLSVTPRCRVWMAGAVSQYWYRSHMFVTCDSVSDFAKISMLNTFRSSSAYVIQFWFWHSGNWCNSSALTEDSKLCRQNVTYDWKGNCKTENDRRKNKLHICNLVSRHHLPVQSRELLTAIDTKFVISLLFHQAPLV